ncbi:MAG: hypothetical protein KF756_06125 [Acidobacteria bacterium]|nr:hypothetical protein [Acidobacteriota bacterium]
MELHLRTHHSLVLAVFMLLIPTTIVAQGICVISEKRVPEIKGIVSFVSQENSVSDANIKLRRKNNGATLETVETDKEGRFKFSGHFRGRFTLIVSRPSAISLYIPIRVVKSEPDGYLQVTLGGVVGDICGGGEVKVIKKE